MHEKGRAGITAIWTELPENWLSLLGLVLKKFDYILYLVSWPAREIHFLKSLLA